MSGVSKEELSKINNMLNNDLEFSERRKISALTVGKIYIIKKMILMITRFGKTILVHLHDETHNVTFETFLPKRVAETVPEGFIETMNQSESKYTLAYLGQSSQAYFGNTRSLLTFGCLE